MMSRFVIATTFFCGLALGQSLSDSKLNEEVDAQLRKECGDSCVQQWHSFAFEAQSQGLDSYPKALQHLMLKEFERAQKLMLDQKDLADTSFITSQLSVPADVPCSDSSSCQALSVLASRCSYGRVGTLATYQAINTAVHIFGVVVSVLCGCVHVASQSLCVTSFAPFCTSPYSVYGKLQSMSSQAWEATKAATKSCKMIGV